MSEIVRLLRMQHYGKGRWVLKVLSTANFWISFCLLFSPFYFPYLFNLIAFILGITVPVDSKNIVFIAGMIVTGLVAIQSAISLTREFFLSRSQIVKADFIKDIIRQLITLLMDAYKWKGTCRVTVFIPKWGSHGKTDKLVIYDRISYGRGPGDFQERKVFFTPGQGIPGKAWLSAWSGEDEETLIESLRIGNVLDDAFRNKETMRKFFKEQFDIADDNIYESLGPKKFNIKSYMSVGILGRFQKLACVLSVDSEDSNKFVDFETLQGVKRGKLTKEEGLAIIGDGESLEKTDSIPKDVEQKLALVPRILKKTISSQEEWEKTKEFLKRISFAAHMVQSQEISLHAPAFMFALGWVLKQLRDLFIIDWGT
jgi:hypothetical protein